MVLGANGPCTLFHNACLISVIISLFSECTLSQSCDCDIDCANNCTAGKYFDANTSTCVTCDPGY